MVDTMLIPDPSEHPTVPLWPTVGQALGFGRTAVYEAARRGELPVPVIRIGHRCRVPTAALLRVLELTAPSGHAA